MCVLRKRAKGVGLAPYPNNTYYLDFLLALYYDLSKGQHLALERIKWPHGGAWIGGREGRKAGSALLSYFESKTKNYCVKTHLWSFILFLLIIYLVVVF